LLSKPHEADGLTDGERRLGDRDVGRGWGAASEAAEKRDRRAFSWGGGGGGEEEQS